MPFDQIDHSSDHGHCTVSVVSCHAYCYDLFDHVMLMLVLVLCWSLVLMLMLFEWLLLSLLSLLVNVMNDHHRSVRHCSFGG